MNANVNATLERNRQEFEEKQKKEREAFERQQQMFIEREQRRETERIKYENFKNELIKDAIDQYGFTQAQAEMIFSRAWDEGHSCGFNEVRVCFEDLIGFLYDFMKA